MGDSSQKMKVVGPHGTYPFMDPMSLYAPFPSYSWSLQKILPLNGRCRLRLMSLMLPSKFLRLGQDDQKFQVPKMEGFLNILLGYLGGGFSRIHKPYYILIQLK